MRIIDTQDAEVEFPGCTLTCDTLRTIWRMPTTGFTRRHLVAVTDTGRVVTWDDRARAWCTMWGESTWGGFVQYASREWLDERLRYDAGKNGNIDSPSV